jgi:hypothetical protein
MIAVSVIVVAAVSSLVIALLLGLFAYISVGLVRLIRRHLGGTVSSRWTTWVGLTIAVVGVIALVWTQVQSPLPTHFGFSAVERWETAVEPLVVIGIGVLVSVAAQILSAIQVRQLVEAIEAGPLSE